MHHKIQTLVQEFCSATSFFLSLPDVPSREWFRSLDLLRRVDKDQPVHSRSDEYGDREALITGFTVSPYAEANQPCSREWTRHIYQCRFILCVTIS